MPLGWAGAPEQHLQPMEKARALLDAAPLMAKAEASQILLGMSRNRAMDLVKKRLFANLGSSSARWCLVST